MDRNSSIFVQAKIEYTKQLINTLKPHMYDGIKSIYDDAKDLYTENSSTSLLFIFRTLLEKIPEWNNELIVTETDRIMECSKCDWLDELVTAVYISHTKILMSIGNNNDNKINLTIPKLINFIHKCYINIARELWKNPLLFSEDISGFEYQKNINTIEAIICDCVENTIRISLPVKEILKEHLDIYDNKSTTSNNSDSKLLNELKELLIKKELIENNDNKEVDVVADDDNDDNDVEGNDDDNKVETTIDSPVEEIKTISKNIQQNVYVNNDGYVSPDEDTINKKTNDLEINDIPDIKVSDDKNQVEGPVLESAEGMNNKVDESTYDNPDIIKDTAKDNNELYEKLIKINDQDKEEVSPENPIIVSKVDRKQDPPEKEKIIEAPPTPVFKPNLSIEEELKNEQDTRKYDDNRIVDITKEEVKIQTEAKTSKEKVILPKKNDLSYIEDIIDQDNKSNKEIMTVDKHEDDNETVDLFYDDLKNMSDKKGLTMDTVDETKYTLFDDLE